MTAATIKKPAKAPAPAVAVAPMTLDQATDVAMAELSKAIDLMVSAQRAAEDGHHLDRALRVAEEIALDVMGWMDHSQHDRHKWADRMFDCQSLLKCAVAYNEGPAATLAAQQAAEALDRATDVLDQPFPETKAAPAAEVASPESVKLDENPHFLLNQATAVFQSAAEQNNESDAIFALRNLAVFCGQRVGQALDDHRPSSYEEASSALASLIDLMDVLDAEKAGGTLFYAAQTLLQLAKTEIDAQWQALEKAEREADHA